MTEIKRYESGHDEIEDCVFDGCRIRGNGPLVAYEDHAAIVVALQEQVRALAAENVALNLSLEPQEVPDELQDLLNDTAKLDIDSEGGLDSDSASGQSWVWVENPDEVIRTVLSAVKPETPATDSVLREIRAQAVDAASDELKDLATRSEGASSEHIHAAALYLMTISYGIRAGVRSVESGRGSRGSCSGWRSLCRGS